MAMTDCSKQLAKLWADIDEAGRGPYDQMAANAKAEYAAAVEQYRKDNPVRHLI